MEHSVNNQKKKKQQNLLLITHVSLFALRVLLLMLNYFSKHIDRLQFPLL